MSGGRERAAELRRMADAAEATSDGSRYVEAMVARARAIAGRMEASGDPASLLPDTLKGVGITDAGSLARALRDGTIHDGNSPGLRKALIEAVRAKLKITNPDFLKGREGSLR